MEKSFVRSLLNSWGAPGWAVLFLFFLSLLFVFVKPLQREFNDLWGHGQQKILSVADNKFSRNSPVRQVLKISTPTGLLLEIYGPADKQGNRSLVESIPLPDKHDAYFHVNGRATNLAFKDMNGDGSAEIVAPTFDDDWNPRLNVFTYDEETESFRALNE